MCKLCKTKKEKIGNRNIHSPVETIIQYRNKKQWQLLTFFTAYSCSEEGITNFFLFFFFSYSLACWDLSSQIRIKPMPPTVEVQSLNHWTARKVSYSCSECTVLSALHTNSNLIPTIILYCRYSYYTKIAESPSTWPVWGAITNERHLYLFPRLNFFLLLLLINIGLSMPFSHQQNFK